MNTPQFLISGWNWNPAVLLTSGAALGIYLLAFGVSPRIGYFGAGLGVVFITLLSPINALADGYLFSAHMLQHILLLLVVPALMLMSLPPAFSPAKSLRAAVHPLAGWLAGVGAMWLWHAPALCNAAVTSRPVHALQTFSLLALGGIFWWQILAPRDGDRLSPFGAIIYLFTACLACSVLGIILTLSPVTVCSIYVHPSDRLGIMNTIQQGWGITSDKDQQIGGLLMWVPMCLIYLGAICGQLVRWYAGPARPLAATEKP